MGGCYILIISFILLIFTASGAVFLVLYMTEPESPTTSLYSLIGATLVCLPWFFWFLTLLYRIISRACGFRMICFGASYSDNAAAAAVNGSGGDVDLGRNLSVAVDSGGGDHNGIDGNVVNKDGEGAAEGPSPRRVHFGGAVVLGEDDGGHGLNPNKEISRSSSSSSSSRHSNESEMPLKLSMA